MIILETYLLVMLLVATRMGWHMMIRLDENDWHYSVPEIWAGFAIYTIAWPLLLMKLKYLVDPSELFQGNRINFAAIQRERDQLWNNPPPCGQRIRYRKKKHPWHKDTYGEFTLDASEVETRLKGVLRFTPNLEEDGDGVLLNWLRQRDDTIPEPTDVPIVGSRFEFIVDDLVRSGVGTVRCCQCDKVIPTEKVVINDDNCKPGSNYDRLVCPDGRSGPHP